MSYTTLVAITLSLILALLVGVVVYGNATPGWPAVEVQEAR